MANRYLCGCCGRKRMGKYMIRTCLPNQNNNYTYFCRPKRFERFNSCCNYAERALKEMVVNYFAAIKDAETFIKQYKQLKK